MVLFMVLTACGEAAFLVCTREPVSKSMPRAQSGQRFTVRKLGDLATVIPRIGLLISSHSSKGLAFGSRLKR